MNLNYSVLFQLTTKHSFYKSSLTNDFEYQPTPSTLKIIESNRLIFKKTEHGFVLLARVSPPDELFNPLPQKGLKFSFMMVPKNSHIYSITKFYKNKFPRPGKEILYFSNLEMADTEFPALGNKLSQPDKLFLHLLTGSILNLKTKTPVGSFQPTIKDVFGNVYTPAKVLLPPGKTTDEFQIDFNKINLFEPGRYTLEEPNLQDPIHFYYEPQFGTPNVFGMVELFSNTSNFNNPLALKLNPKYQFLAGEKIPTPAAHYEIRLEPSTYLLKYIVRIAPKATQSINLVDLKIVIPGISPSQDKQFDVKLEGADPSKPDYAIFSFVKDTTTLITWSETPQEFILKGHQNVLLKVLPNPTVFHPLIKLPDPNDVSNALLCYKINVFI